MKKLIKAVHKRHPALAEQVAHVTGFRITKAKDDTDIPQLKADAAQLIYTEFLKAAEKELGNQKIAKTKILPIIQSILNIRVHAKVAEVLSLVMEKKSERAKIIKELIESTVNWL